MAWARAPRSWCSFSDNGDVIICGGAKVYRSADGLNSTRIGNGLANLSPPPPYQSGLGAIGQPRWMGGTILVPAFNSGLNWHRGVGRMP